MAGEVSSSEGASDRRTDNRFFTNALAMLVFGASFAGLMIAGWWYLPDNNGKAREVFNVLAPLFGTWVGTVLTFYFTRENFKEANDAVNKIMERVTPAQGIDQTPVRDAMKLRARIEVLALNGRDESGLKLSELREIIRKNYSRVLVFGSDETVKYVIHESTLNKFIADRIMSAGAQTVPQQDQANATLAELLAYKPVGGKISMAETVKLFSFVGEGATLADARVAMTSTPGCEDVFVTKTGKASEPVLGWLTNSDITRQL